MFEMIQFILFFGRLSNFLKSNILVWSVVMAIKFGIKFLVDYTGCLGLFKENTKLLFHTMQVILNAVVL